VVVADRGKMVAGLRPPSTGARLDFEQSLATGGRWTPGAAGGSVRSSGTLTGTTGRRTRCPREEAVGPACVVTPNTGRYSMRLSSWATALKRAWAGAAVLIVLGAVPVLGATITVTSTADSGPGSLRAAIAGAASGDTIVFSLPYPTTIFLSSPLRIESSQGKALTIQGPGASLLSISGGDGAPVLLVQPLGGLTGAISATISGLTIERGSSLLGGGIYNGGFLVLLDCTITNNSVGNQFGGGLFNAGQVIMRNSTITDNRAGRPGGPGQGGGIYNSATGSLIVDDSLIAGNSADHLGAGGGLVNEGFTSLQRTVVASNRATHGGGLYNTGDLDLLQSAVLSNQASGIFPHVGRGGGIYNFSDGTQPGSLTLTRTTVSLNETGLERDDGTVLRGVGYGGGVYNDEGSLIVTRTTVSHNFGGGNIPGCCALSGGGILNSGHLEGGRIFMSNSTVAGNHTPDGSVVGGNGAGISNPGGVLDIKFSTVAGNSAFRGPETGGDFSIESGHGGGILHGLVFPQASILAHNSGGNCHELNLARSSSAGHNLADDATCADLLVRAGDLNSTPAGLDPAGLKNNGGPTETIALLATSPALDAVPLTACREPIITIDQRGVPRPQGPACDIGAYEYFRSRFELFAVEIYGGIEQVHSSPLPPGIEQGLIAPLQAAVASLNRGAVEPAINQLGAFINQTEALVRRGTLTSEQASALTSPARHVIQGLGGDGGGETLRKAAAPPAGP
jgi:hypothetical protein